MIRQTRLEGEKKKSREKKRKAGRKKEKGDGAINREHPSLCYYWRLNTGSSPPRAQTMWRRCPCGRELLVCTAHCFLVLWAVTVWHTPRHLRHRKEIPAGHQLLLTVPFITWVSTSTLNKRTFRTGSGIINDAFALTVFKQIMSF